MEEVKNFISSCIPKDPTRRRRVVQGAVLLTVVGVAYRLFSSPWVQEIRRDLLLAGKASYIKVGFEDLIDQVQEAQSSIAFCRAEKLQKSCTDYIQSLDKGIQLLEQAVPSPERVIRLTELRDKIRALAVSIERLSKEIKDVDQWFPRLATDLGDIAKKIEKLDALRSQLLEVVKASSPDVQMKFNEYLMRSESLRNELLSSFKEAQANFEALTKGGHTQQIEKWRQLSDISEELMIRINRLMDYKLFQDGTENLPLSQAASTVAKGLSVPKNPPRFPGMEEELRRMFSAIHQARVLN
jgi:hypothetical protein